MTPNEQTLGILNYIVTNGWCTVEDIAKAQNWNVNTLYQKMKRLHDEHGWVRRGPSTGKNNVLAYNITRKGLAFREAYTKESK